MNTAPAKGKLVSLAAIAAAILVIDQITKALVTERLALGASTPIVPDFLHFTLVRNTGMAFGLLSRADLPYKAALVTLLSAVAMAAVVYYALQAPDNDRLTRGGLAFILGGALGNIVDRVRLGYVVDFIDVFYGNTHWPAFNVADSCICIGVGLLLIDGFKQKKPEAAMTVPVSAGQGDR